MLDHRESTCLVLAKYTAYWLITHIVLNGLVIGHFINCTVQRNKKTSEEPHTGTATESPNLLGTRPLQLGHRGLRTRHCRPRVRSARSRSSDPVGLISQWFNIRFLIFNTIYDVNKIFNDQH